MAKNSCGHDDCFTCPYPDCVAVFEQKKRELSMDEKSIRHRENVKRWQKEHPEYMKEYKRKWYREHREEELKKLKDKREAEKEYAKATGTLTYHQRYYQANRERLIAKEKAYYQEHREKQIEYMREYNKKRGKKAVKNGRVKAD